MARTKKYSRNIGGLAGIWQKVYLCFHVLFQWSGDQPKVSILFLPSTPRGIVSPRPAVWASIFLLGWFMAFSASLASAAERLDSQIEFTQEEEIFLRDNPVIRVHNETDWPPFNFYEDGTPQGLSVEYMNILAEKIGIKVKYISGPSWNDFLEMMKSGDLDVMLNIVKTPERQKYLLYTKPYIRNPNTILSRRDTPFNSLEQLFGKTVSLPKGFFYEEILKRDFPKIKLHLVKNVQESMKAVIFGKADAAVGELAVFNHLMSREMMTGLVLKGEVKLGSPEYEVLNIATRKDLPLLISILRKAMAVVSSDEMKALRQRWIGELRTVTSQPKPELTVKEKNWLNEHKNMRFGVDPGYPPFEFFDDEGVFSGMSSDYIALISERLGITMEVVPNLTWPEVIFGLEGQALDFSPAVVETPDRKEMMKFSRPHMSFPVVIITRDDYALIAGLDDLFGLNTALVEELAVTEDILKNHPEISPNMVDTPLQALQSVAAGKNEAAVMNLAVATYLIKNNNLANLKVAAPAEIDLPGLSFAVRKDWPEFVGILNKTLASITPEEESAIRAKWVNVSYNTGINLEYVLQAGGAGAFIVIVVVLWNRRLQREVVQRKQAEENMEAAKNEAERATQAKSDFIAAISHEVRTPMNGVLGMARLLSEMELDREQQSCVDTITTSGESLITIINDLLDISKLDANRLEIESIPFSIYDEINQAIAIMKSPADERGLLLSANIDDGIPDVLIGDPHRLQQIILNLVSNAIKFTDVGSVVVDIKFVSQTDDNANVLFSVTDTGRGITKEVIERLFSKYTQGSVEVARKYGGTGLGLAICRRLAELMGGKVSVESIVRHGTTFSLTLPFAIGRHDDLQAEKIKTKAKIVSNESLPSTKRSLCVLQAEDNETNRTVVERILSRVGHAVASVQNGQQAVDEAKTGAFDVILMDRHMPVMDGLDATRAIRALGEPIASIPIIGITAGAGKDEVAACIDAGMDECLIKPVDPAQLRNLLVSISENKKIQINGQRNIPDIAEIAENSDGQPISLSRLAQALDEDDHDILFHLLDIFNAEFPNLLARINEAIKKRDATAVHHSAHAAKGAAANAAAARLTNMLKDVQEMAHLEDWDEIKSRTGAIAVEYDKVVKFCDKNRPGDKEKQDA